MDSTSHFLKSCAHPSLRLETAIPLRRSPIFPFVHLHSQHDTRNRFVDCNADVHLLGYVAPRLSLHVPTCIIRILFLDIPGPSSSKVPSIAVALFLGFLRAVFPLLNEEAMAWNRNLIEFHPIVTLCILVPSPIPSHLGEKYST